MKPSSSKISNADEATSNEGHPQQSGSSSTVAVPQKPRMPHPKKRHPVRAVVEVSTVRLFGKAMEGASWTACRHTGAWLGLLFWHAARSRHGIAVGNVQRAFPHLSHAAATRIARRAAQNFAMMFCEFLHLRTASPAEVREYCQWDGQEHLQAGLELGHGVIMLSAHFGNWEVMGSRISQEFAVTGVVRPRSNAGIDQHIEDVRRAAGMKVLSKFESPRGILNVLRNNGLLCILPDQHAGTDGALLPLFGQPTRFATSLPRLAMMSGAPIVPSFGVRRTPWLADGRITATIWPGYFIKRSDYPSRDEAVLDGTRRVIADLETIIRRHPDQWMWMHRRWRTEDAEAAQAQADQPAA